MEWVKSLVKKVGRDTKSWGGSLVETAVPVGTSVGGYLLHNDFTNTTPGYEGIIPGDIGLFVQAGDCARSLFACLGEYAQNSMEWVTEAGLETILWSTAVIGGLAVAKKFRNYNATKRARNQQNNRN